MKTLRVTSADFGQEAGTALDRHRAGYVGRPLAGDVNVVFSNSMGTVHVSSIHVAGFVVAGGGTNVVVDSVLSAGDHVDCAGDVMADAIVSGTFIRAHRIVANAIRCGTSIRAATGILTKCVTSLKTKEDHEND